MVGRGTAAVSMLGATVTVGIDERPLERMAATAAADAAADDAWELGKLARVGTSGV